MKTKDTLLNFGILLLRVGLGITMMIHGVPKLMSGAEMWTGLGGAMANLGVNFAPTFWGFMAAFAEGVGGLLLVVGLFTRPAALMLAFNMLVAMLMHKAMGDGFMGYGHALDLMIVFAAVIFIGAGRYSLDKKIMQRIA